MEALLIIALIVLLLIIGAQLFLIIGVLALSLFVVYGDVELFSLSKTMFDSLNKSILLSIPLYVFAGAVMAKGEIAKRLIDLSLAAFGWLKGGLAIGAVFACVFFAAISGSSPVTLIAIGTILYPAMLENGYPKSMALGILTVSGSLGILIPPSIPMIIFSIVTGADVQKLFIAGIIPGIITALLLIIIALILAQKHDLVTQPFSMKALSKSFTRSIPALLMPVFILGGIYSGIYNVTEAAAVGSVYAVLIELFYFRQMKMKDLVNTLYDSVIVLGIIFIIIAMATIFNYYVVLEDVPNAILESLKGYITSPTMFIVVTILLLLIIGLFMDSISAILIVAPLILPLAILYDIDLIHLGIVFILALEIGYITPPVGVNLFVSAGVFSEPFGKIVTACIPYLLMVVVALLIVSFIPELFLWLF